MEKLDYQKFREKIIENIGLTLTNLEDNPVMEHYNARNLESYLRSLEILKRMWKENV